MTTPAAHCEAILRGYSKRADKDGDWIEVKFQLHPQDIPELLNSAPLRTRFMLALAQIGDDEKPVDQPAEGNGDKPKRHFADLPLSQQAALACHDEAFQVWLLGGPGNHESAVSEVRLRCEVESRRYFDLGGRGAAKWKELYANYQRATGRIAEAR